MAKLHTDAGIDWMACELIEQIPGKVSGRPIVRGTRIMPDGIVNSYDMGESIEDIQRGLAFAFPRPDQASDRVCSRSSRATEPVKVLLDENLAHRLRKNLGAHEVLLSVLKVGPDLRTANFCGLAEDDRIEVLLTGDQTLSYEQNLTGRAIAIVALSSVEWDILKNHLPLIIAAIDRALPGTFQAVDCGTFTRKK